VRKTAISIRSVAATLEDHPERFLPETELKDDEGRILVRQLPRAAMAADASDFVNIDNIVALAKELREAKDALSAAASNAARLGVPV
jgi:hypothetical protein